MIRYLWFRLIPILKQRDIRISWFSLWHNVQYFPEPTRRVRAVWRHHIMWHPTWCVHMMKHNKKSIEIATSRFVPNPRPIKLLFEIHSGRLPSQSRFMYSTISTWLQYKVCPLSCVSPCYKERERERGLMQLLTWHSHLSCLHSLLWRALQYAMRLWLLY